MTSSLTHAPTTEVVVKLIDFEFAYQYSGDEMYLDTGCYTSGYMPLGAQSQQDTRATIVLLKELMTDTSKYKTHRHRLARFVD